MKAIQTTTLESSLKDLDNVCKELCRIIEGNEHIIFLLQGDIGAGKTSLVARYTKFIEIGDCVTSPTFSLMHQYGNNIFHYDLFNRNLEDSLALGLLDLLEVRGIHFVEWGDMRLFEILQSAFGCVYIISIDKLANKRIYNIT